MMNDAPVQAERPFKVELEPVVVDPTKESTDTSIGNATNSQKEDNDDKEKVLESRDDRDIQKLASSSTETLATGHQLMTKNHDKDTSPQMSSDTPVLAKEDKPSEDGREANPRPVSIRAEVPIETHLFDGDLRREGDWDRHENPERPPWPLLSSPKTPTPEEADPRRAAWARSSSRRDSGTRPPREVLRFNPSPTNGWPQRSPLKSDRPHDQEEASFTLFTHSFDTLSETGNYLKEMGQQQDAQYYASPAKPHGQPPKKIELALGTQDHSDSSVGDISPIKLVQHKSMGRQDAPRHRSSSHHSRHGQGMVRRAERQDHGPPESWQGHYADGQYGNPYGWIEDDRQMGGASSRPSNPFFVLRSVYKAFSSCSYLLPCLRERDICPVNLSPYTSIRHYQENGTPDSQAIAAATRRVEAAICAFGGYLKSKQPSPSQATSIFRFKTHRKTPSKEYYDDRFHRRYFVSGNRISWELEDNPPVHLEARELPNYSTRNLNAARDENGDSHGSGVDPHYMTSHEEGNKAPEDGSLKSSGSIIPSENQQKMKYRCKLCGQLKQNHNCPYQQSLQRSIAVMVYPAVNAYTASEPGILTKPLSEMNNFVSYDSDKGSPNLGYHQSDAAGNPMPLQITHVTPETKTRGVLHSPQSSLSTHSPDISPHKKSSSESYEEHPPGTAILGGLSGNPRKRAHTLLSRDGPDGVLRVTHPTDGTSTTPFVASLTLRPEHYRAVTPKPKGEQPEQQSNAYQYPHIPLTFTERKRLSDTLFFLSKEIPTMTGDVAELLRGARQQDEWDLAVAEVLTQVVVGLYCWEGDHRLDGLRHYLLGIGISC